MMKRFLIYTLIALMVLSGTPAYAQRPIGGAGGSGGASFNGVLLDAAAGDPVTDTSNNAIRVNIVAGAVGGSGGTSIGDDNAFTPATSLVTPTGFMFDDVSPDSVNEGDAGVGRMSANRNAYVQIRDNAGNERGLNIDANGAIAAVVSDGSGALNVIIDSSATLTVNSHAVTNAGTFVVQENGAALTALQLIDNIVAAEDAVAGSAYAAVPMVVVRQDSQSALAADGDFITPTVDSSGGLRVSIVAGAGSGGTALADDADFTDGTTSGTPIGGVAESAAPSTVTEGDFGWAAITLNRALKTALYNSSGTEITFNSDLTVGTAFGTTGPGLLAQYQDFDGSALATVTNVDTELEALPLTASIKGILYTMPTNEDGSKTPFVDEDVASAAADLLVKVAGIRDDTLDARSGTEGDYEMFHMNANGALWAVDVNSASALTALQLIDNIVSVEDAVAGSAFSGVGFLAVRQDSQSALAADGDFIPPTIDASGGLRVSIVSGAGSGGTALADDADFTAGTTSFTPVGGFYQSTVTACTDGDTCAVRITAGRAITVAIVNPDGSATTYATDATIGTAIGTSGPLALGEYKEFDGSALPTTTNVNTEGEALTFAASLQGVQYNYLVNEDGSKSAFVDEDVASAAADLLVKVAGIRDDTLDARSGTEGDYEMFHMNANGALWTADVNSAAMTTSLAIIDNVVFGAGTEAAALRVTIATDSTGVLSVDDNGGSITVDGSISCSNCSGSGASDVDDSSFAVATDSVAPAGGMFDDTSPDSVDEGDSGVIRMSANRNMYMQIRDAAGNERGVNVNASNQLAIAGPVTNAGTFVTQENGPALTSLQLIDDTVVAEDVASAGADPLMRIAAIRDDTLDARSGTEGDYEMFHLNANGALWTIDVNSAANLTSTQLLDDVVFTDDAAFTPGTSKGNATMYQVDDASTDSVDEGDAGTPRMSVDRVAYAAVGATAAAGASALECSIVSAASTNSTNCKNAAGNFYGIDLVNTTTTTYYLRLYNTSSAPTCSSATGFIRSVPIPPAGAAGQAGGIVRVSPVPVAYATGISFCLTGGASSTDNTSAATGIYGAILYK